ncbi:hypothetical protein B0H67DRAFT_597512 [Lasiosphaeris hirsuta]|uniref:Uncharacterized protein n=1 Tax=Lasiosphaeris hirsuta TaxID=260670 RepID=A0AA40EBW2_9PEZI|nr:hypothetical protein B0H67DRAFT_597512 [Lasiosphaeris hirsuta]
MDVPVALITAGTAGLGAATARLLARNGFSVVVNYNSDHTRAKAFVDELTRISTLQRQSPLLIGLNIESPNFCSYQADLSKSDEIGRLANSTITSMGRLDVDHCLNLNVKSHLWLMKATRSYLDETEGIFITTASLAGVKFSGSSLAYAVTKAAQIHLVKGLATMAAPKIRVNSVSPGLILTDVAEQVLCFIKSKSVTGANTVIDGGMSL